MSYKIKPGFIFKTPTNWNAQPIVPLACSGRDGRHLVNPILNPDTEVEVVGVSSEHGVLCRFRIGQHFPGPGAAAEPVYTYFFVTIDEADSWIQQSLTETRRREEAQRRETAAKQLILAYEARQAFAQGAKGSQAPETLNGSQCEKARP